jgi:hypothetical protein
VVGVCIPAGEQGRARQRLVGCSGGMAQNMYMALPGALKLATQQPPLPGLQGFNAK